MAKRSGIVLTLSLFACVFVSQAAPDASPQDPAAAQGATPTFRSTVRYLEVDATVRDRNGQFVANLTRDDFELFEDGKAQTIDRLTVFDLAQVEKAAQSVAIAPSAPPGGLSSAEVYERSGRIYVMVLDTGPTDRVEEIASTFITDHVGPADLMAIVNVNSRIHQPLTGDRTRLLDAGRQYASGPPGTATFTSRLKRTAATLKDVAVNLGAVRGRRKAIIYVGEGMNLWTTRMRTGANDPQLAAEDLHDVWSVVTDMTRTAAAYNIPIHAVSPMGYRPLPAGSGGFGFNAAWQPPDEATGYRTWGRLGTGFPDYLFADTPADADAGLALLSEDTGGIAIVNTNNYGGSFQKITERDTQYYVIGYYSSIERDGKFHPLSIRVKRPGLTVSARAGLRALKPLGQGKSVKLPRTLTNAAKTALKSGTLKTGTAGSPALRTSATMFRGSSFSGSVLVHTVIEGRQLNLAADERIEVSAAAVNSDGRILAVDRRGFSLDLKPESRARVEREGLHVFSRLSLGAGTYDVRVAVNQPNGVTGVTSTVVEVPDFTDGTLFFSDVLIGKDEPLVPVTLVADPIAQRVMPAGPSAHMRFSPGDRLRIYGEVYDTHWLLSQQTGVTMTVRNADGEVLSKTQQAVERPAEGRASFDGIVDLKNMRPGTYMLSIEASSLDGPAAFATRQVEFDVVDTDSVRPPVALPDSSERFEFVSIRRVPPVCPAFSLSVRCESQRPPRAFSTVTAGGRLEATAVTPIDLIYQAYGLSRRDASVLTGGPDWLRTERYDIVGAASADGSSEADLITDRGRMRERLRALLDDRFALQIRTEDREVRVKVLTRTGSSAPSPRPVQPGTCVPDAQSMERLDLAPAPQPCSLRYDSRRLEARGITMAGLARVLEDTVGGPIVDETGLAGLYDVALAIPTPFPSLVSLNTALSQQGLRLVEAKRRIPRLVIARAEKPTAD